MTENQIAAIPIPKAVKSKPVLCIRCGQPFGFKGQPPMVKASETSYRHRDC